MLSIMPRSRQLTGSAPAGHLTTGLARYALTVLAFMANIAFVAIMQYYVAWRSRMALSTPVTPSEHERKLIETFARALENVPANHAQITVDGKTIDSLAVPKPVFEVLRLVADQMAKGRAISVVPTKMLVTTQQAAELLGSSRQHVVKLLTDGEIAYEKVGTHRRIRIEDLIAYKQRRQSTRDDALRRLSEQAERLELKY
jgi:excisionase family DNA binding protein